MKEKATEDKIKALLPFVAVFARLFDFTSIAGNIITLTLLRLAVLLNKYKSQVFFAVKTPKINLKR